MAFINRAQRRKESTRDAAVGRKRDDPLKDTSGVPENMSEKEAQGILIPTRSRGVFGEGRAAIRRTGSR
jgi:hypothetical protein